MRRLSIEAVLVILLAWTSQAGAQESGKKVEVRGLSFGADEATIRRAEKSKFVRERRIGAVKILHYSDSLLGEPVAVGYRLLNGALYEIRYIFERPGGCSHSLSLYEKLHAELAVKYGEPKAKSFDDERKCIRITEWNYSGDGRPTTIYVGLDGTKHRSSLAVFYFDQEQAARVDAAQDAVDEGKL
ncbi:hypothetical protein [Tautonia sociabilis]|uniref:Uncharacterized protein n=1 Tax=Tautonia sociabilis TaxID=2080755 RepID=A0A432MHZ0_9BACT|nr:hypothetical protein [Tautonia sociabilis]RUL86981.1 hypothetical protein TsocGM_14385 [Tautonia sociabilis]